MPVIKRYAPHFLFVALVSVWQPLSFINDNLLMGVDAAIVLQFSGLAAVAGALLFCLFRGLIRLSAPRAAGLTSALMAGGFSFILVQDVLHRLNLELSNTLTWAAFQALLVVLAWAFIKSERAVRFLTLVVGVAVLIPTGQLLVSGGGHLFSDGSGGPTASAESGQTTPAKISDRPNIYYVLLDSYGGADEIRKYTGFDNTSFLSWLEEHGFTVQKNARSNFVSTDLSNVNAIAMDYLLDKQTDAETSETIYMSSVTFPEMRGIISGGNVPVRRLRQSGYAYMTSSYWCNRAVDRCVNGLRNLSEETWVLLNMTPLPVVLSHMSSKFYNWLASEYVDEIPYLTNAVSQFRTRPYFFYGQYFALHDSIYTRDCAFSANLPYVDPKRVDNEARFISDTKAYVDTLVCVNNQLKEFVEKVTTTDPSAIIILTADHGTAFAFETGKAFKDGSEDFFRERTSILSAWRLPEHCRKKLPATMTSINHFRFLMSCIYDEPYEAKPDRYFAHDFDYLTQFEIDPAVLNR